MSFSWSKCRTIDSIHTNRDREGERETHSKLPFSVDVSRDEIHKVWRRFHYNLNLNFSSVYRFAYNIFENARNVWKLHLTKDIQINQMVFIRKFNDFRIFARVKFMFEAVLSAGFPIDSGFFKWKLCFLSVRMISDWTEWISFQPTDFWLCHWIKLRIARKCCTLKKERRSNALNIDWKLHIIKSLDWLFDFRVDFVRANETFRPKKGLVNATKGLLCIPLAIF